MTKDQTKTHFSVLPATQENINWWQKDNYNHSPNHNIQQYPNKTLAHFLANVPPEKVFWGSVVVTASTSTKELRELAKYEVITGNLIFEYGADMAIFNLKKIVGSLRLDACNIGHNLPNLDEIGGNLVVVDADIHALANLKEIGGHLKMKNAVFIHAPRLKKIGKHMLLKHSSLVHAPCLKFIGGNIALLASEITHRPTNCFIGGDIYNLKEQFKKTKRVETEPYL